MASTRNARARPSARMSFVSIASPADGCASAAKNASSSARSPIPPATRSRRSGPANRSARMISGTAATRIASAAKWVKIAERSGIHCSASSMPRKIVGTSSGIIDHVSRDDTSANSAQAGLVLPRNTFWIARR